jgi:thioredoxin 1
MSNLKLVNDGEFDSAVIKTKKTALVFFTAIWSAPCRMSKPDVEQVAFENQHKLAFYEIDAETNTTPTKYNIRSVPVVLIFKDGQLVSQFSGAPNKAKLIEMIGKI